MAADQDAVIRAMTDDDAFRVIAARTTDTVQGAIGAQQVHGDTAARLAELITGAILVRETMAPALRVQGILLGANGSGQLVADSHPEGWARGLVQTKGKNGIQLGQGAQLQMMRTLPNGGLHRGVVEVPVDRGISGALMNYMQNSEQVVSVIAVGCAVDDNRVVSAGGYIVQLLPEAPEPTVMVMTERLADFAASEPLLHKPNVSAEEMVNELLYAMPFTQLERSPLRFECNCSQVRVLASLATLSRADIEQFIEEGEELEMSCDYCGLEYRVAPEELRGLLESS